MGGLKNKRLPKRKTGVPYDLIDVSGFVEGPKDAEEFSDAFIDWIETKGWTFGGGIGPYVEGGSDCRTTNEHFTTIPLDVSWRRYNGRKRKQ